MTHTHLSQTLPNITLIGLDVHGLKVFIFCCRVATLASTTEVKHVYMENPYLIAHCLIGKQTT